MIPVQIKPGRSVGAKATLNASAYSTVGMIVHLEVRSLDSKYGVVLWCAVLMNLEVKKAGGPTQCHSVQCMRTQRQDASLDELNWRSNLAGYCVDGTLFMETTPLTT